MGNKNFKEVMMTLSVSLRVQIFLTLACLVTVWSPGTSLPGSEPFGLLSLTSGPGDLCEELRLQVPHPGHNTGFY